MEIAWNLMKWPLLACLILPAILVYYGLHIVRREIIFVDLALAQVAALGTCLAVLLGYDVRQWQTFAWGIGFTLVGAVVFTLTRRRNPRVPQEALIGIVYVVAAAAGMLLLSHNSEGDEQLKRTLVGEVLLVRPRDVLTGFGLFAVVGLLHYFWRRQFLLISFEPERAMAEGVRIARWDLAFYVLFGLVVTTFVQIGGVLLTFSYLIIPAVCASYLVGTLRARLWTAWAVAVAGGALGAGASYKFDLPTGGAIVCMLGVLLLAVQAFSALWRASRQPLDQAQSGPQPNPRGGVAPPSSASQERNRPMTNPAKPQQPETIAAPSELVVKNVSPQAPTISGQFQCDGGQGRRRQHAGKTGQRHWFRITGLPGWRRAQLGLPGFGNPHCVSTPSSHSRLGSALRRFQMWLNGHLHFRHGTHNLSRQGAGSQKAPS